MVQPPTFTLEIRNVLGFETFEVYCKARWDFVGCYVRSLARLNADQQHIAWKGVVETAPDCKVTRGRI